MEVTTGTSEYHQFMSVMVGWIVTTVRRCNVMGATPILLANEPRVYRETIAAALQLLRPETRVIVADPDMLDASVLEHVPMVVICSHLTNIVETRVPTWAVLYPDGAMGAVVQLDCEQKVINGLDLAGIMHLVDHTCQNHIPRGQMR